MDETLRKIWIMDDPALYGSFIDEDWARETGSRVRNTAMDLPFHNMLFSWREASYAHQMPRTMVEQLKGFAKTGAMEVNPYGIRLITALRDQLVTRMGDDLNPTKRKMLQSMLDQIDTEVQQNIKSDDIEFPAMEYWNDLCKKDAFQLSISGTQGMAYCSLYFAYEHFLGTSYRAVSGDATLTTKNGKAFWAAFEACFGSEVLEFCVNHGDIKIARLTRNDYVHNGSQPGNDLRALPHDLKIDPATGLFCITAVNTHQLYRTLQPRVGKVITAAVEKLSVVG